MTKRYTLLARVDGEWHEMLQTRVKKVSMIAHAVMVDSGFEPVDLALIQTLGTAWKLLSVKKGN